MSMSKQEEVEAIELHMGRAREFIKEAAALRRLRNHADFQTVVEKGYFEKNAVRLVGLKASPQMQTPEKQAGVVRAIDAIGELQQHFNAVFMMAAEAETAITESHEELAAMDEEGVDS
jgi:hypothetical protein